MADEFDDVKEKTPETRLKEVGDDDTLYKSVDDGRRLEGDGIQAISGSRQSVIGSTLAGNIYVEEMIGKGGMSSVYKGRHTQIDRPVAIKVMHEHLLSEENALLRFQKEAQAAGKLDHPNVVKVADFRVGENGRSFVVMDYVPGISLSEAIARQGPLGKEEALELFSQACDALSHAHDNGVVHRDLKPSNIMLVDSPDGGKQVKLLDFGIAKILPQHGGSGQKLTQTGEVFGSPLYMSPEQCMGKSLDLRSDIYSMGCVLYEALSGKPPILGANTFETFFKHTTEMPASLRTHRDDLESASEFDALILKAMAKNPGDRYQSMAELKADLLKVGTIKDKNLLQKARDNVEFQRRKGSARKSGLRGTAIASACILVLVVSLIGSGMFSRHQDWQQLYVEGQDYFDRGEYKLAFEDFKQALAASPAGSPEQRAVYRELVDLSRVTEAVSGKEFENALAAAEDADLAEIDHELTGLVSRFESSLKKGAGNHVESERIAHEINDKAARLVYGSSTERARAGSALKAVVDAFGRGFSGRSLALGRSIHNLAFIDYTNGDYKQATDGFQRAAKEMRSVVKSNPSAFEKLFFTLQWLARSADNASDYKLEEEVLDEMLSLARNSTRPDAMLQMANNLHVAQCKFQLAEFYLYRKKDYLQARQYAREALRTFEKANNRDAVQLANSHCLLGRIELSDGKTDLAQGHFQAAIENFQALKVRDSGYFVDALYGLAQTFEIQKKPVMARSLYLRALSIALRSMPLPESTIANVFHRLESLTPKGASGAAERKVLVDLFKIKLANDEVVYGKNSDYAIEDFRKLAELSRLNGDLKLALEYSDSGLSRADQALPGWSTVGLLTDRAIYQFDSRAAEAAEATLTKAVSVAQALAPPINQAVFERLADTIEQRTKRNDLSAKLRRLSKQN